MISIDWKTKVITVPTEALALVQASPAVYEIKIDWLHNELRAMEDNEIGITYDVTHKHTAPLTFGGITLARVVEIINGYTVTFEPGNYRVNVVGGNSNVAEVINYNEVQVTTANSAGLTDVTRGMTVEQAQTVLASLSRMLKVYGMVPEASYQMPPGAGTVLEDGNPVADVTGDCQSGFTVTGREAVST